MVEQQLAKLKKLTPIEVRQRIIGMSGWSVENGRLEKEYRFQNFARAMVFVNKLVNPIEEYQNYPRILITYDRVHVSLFTNQVGAITETDIAMAKEFDELSGEKPDEMEGMIKA